MDGVLLEAKGLGYAEFVKNGRFHPWFRGQDELLAQAERQLRAAGDFVIRWHVAEEEAVEAIRDLLARNGVTAQLG
jgi:hypothetical protein